MNLIGQRLDQYQVISLIGRGGMATVYKAYQASLDRYVAIKVLPTQVGPSTHFKERFLREAKAVAQLSHPNILPIYDVNLSDNISYFVMKYVSGQTLKQRLNQPLSLLQTSRYLDQIASALDHAHRRGILHRDIKPSNVLLDEDEDWLLLADFGLAKLMKVNEALTGVGEFMGTPAYISPEQARGESIDSRADVYSLGVVLYEMVTGQLPFESDSSAGLIYQHIHETPPPPRKLKPDVPETVENIVLKALSKNPAHRYEQPGHLATALRQIVTISDNDQLTETQSMQTIISKSADRSKPANIHPEKNLSTITANPYTSRAVIKDLNIFFGREAQLQDIFTLLAGMQSCSIVGPRRIGKSSLLYHLTHPSIYETYLPNPTAYVFAFVDLQELAGLGPDDFCSIIVEQLDRASQRRLQVDLDRDGTRMGIRRFLMRTTDAGLRLVICCDEFEMLSQNSNFEVDFFTYLRGLCSNYNLALITSSRTSLFDLCHQGDLQTSQFWNIFTERILGLMAADEAESLIVTPFTKAHSHITDKEVAFILDLAGCHPFFIQIACYHLFAAQLTANFPDWSIVEDHFFKEAYPHFVYAWSQLSVTEQQALINLSQKKNCAIDPPVFQRLVRDVLVTGRPTTPSIVSRSWQSFVESQAPAIP